MGGQIQLKAGYSKWYCAVAEKFPAFRPVPVLIRVHIAPEDPLGPPFHECEDFFTASIFKAFPVSSENIGC